MTVNDEPFLANCGELLLDFDSLPRHLDVEQKLSRLTRWVLDAEAAQREAAANAARPRKATAISCRSTVKLRSRN